MIIVYNYNTSAEVKVYVRANKSALIALIIITIIKLYFGILKCGHLSRS